MHSQRFAVISKHFIVVITNDNATISSKQFRLIAFKGKNE